MEGKKNLVATTRTFFREVLGEVNKVVWPDKERTTKLTSVVIAMTALIAVYLFVLDIPLNYIMQRFLGR